MDTSAGIPKAEAKSRTASEPWPFHNERLNMPAPIRIPGGALIGFVTRTVVGMAQGGKMAGLVFRAEHAHILPTTTTGWYFYHKSKNYHVMLGAVKKGLKSGTKGGLGVAGFMAIEEAVDRWRGKSDFLSTSAAGLCCGGIFSLWKRFSVPTAARTVKVGLGYGLLFGILQDAVGLLRGRKPEYVRFILGEKDHKSVSSE